MFLKTTPKNLPVKLVLFCCYDNKQPDYLITVNCRNGNNDEVGCTSELGELTTIRKNVLFKTHNNSGNV